MIDVCVMSRKTSVEPGNGLKEVEVLAKKMLRRRSRLECFCYCCVDGWTRECFRLGEAEELYAHFRPTRVLVEAATTAISISHPFIYHWQTP